MKGMSFYEHDFFVIKTDYELAAESITRIIMTNPGERVDLPFFGVGLKNRLFEPLDTDSEGQIENDIREQIETYEPRVIIETIEFNPIEEQNTLEIKIGFILQGDNISDERFINLTFELEE